MSSLSFENIDRWLFEYTEGNLSPEQVSQLENFLSIHPELQLELDAWKASKVTPEAQTASKFVGLQKSYTAWPLITTLLLAVVGTGMFFYLYDFTVDAKYAQKAIDLEMFGEEDNFIFTGRSMVAERENSAQHKLSNSLHNEPSTDEGVAFSNAQSVSTINFADHKIKNSATNSQKSHTSFKHKDGLSINKLSSLQIAVEKDNYDNDFYEDYTAWLYEAPELDQVKLSLNNEFVASNDYALNNNNSRLSSTKTKTSFSSKAKSMFRKVQRMMDQPVALRNFKDPHYAIPNLSSFQANFGMVGTMIQHRFQATSRNQWVGRENQQLMNRLAWDGYIRPLRGGIGIDLSYNDYQNGSIKDMMFGITYSPKFSVSKNVSFEPAVRFKMGVTDVDLNSGVIGSTIEMNRRNSITMFENNQNPLGSQLWYRDMGVGALVNTKWFYAGVNLNNLGRHYNNFYSSDLSQNYEADLDFSAVFGTEYKSLNKDITLSTYLYYQNFGQVNEAWGGANIRWRNIQLGAATSNNLDLGATAGIVFDRFTVHYNLDYLTSVVLDQKMLSHQVTM